MPHEDVAPVVVVDPFDLHSAFTIINPRGEVERCESIHERHGLAHAGCRGCAQLVDACHDAAALYDLLLHLDPDSTVPPLEAVIASEGAGGQYGFAIVG